MAIDKFKEISALSQRAVAQNDFVSAINSKPWKDAAEIINTIAVPKDIHGSDESFMENSDCYKKIISLFNCDELSIPALILISNSAKAIEYGDTKAATFVRDTTGGKPPEHVDVKHSNNISELTDEQLDYCIEHAQVVDK